MFEFSHKFVGQLLVGARCLTILSNRVKLSFFLLNFSKHPRHTLNYCCGSCSEVLPHAFFITWPLKIAVSFSLIMVPVNVSQTISFYSYPHEQQPLHLPVHCHRFLQNDRNAFRRNRSLRGLVLF